jgi:hypothetical protein
MILKNKVLWREVRKNHLYEDVCLFLYSNSLWFMYTFYIILYINGYNNNDSLLYVFNKN